MIVTPLDLGHGVVVRIYRDRGDDPAGLIFLHHAPDGSECDGGSIRFDTAENADRPAETKWQINSVDPLDLSPSLLCRGCGTHGWVRAGRWVPA